MKWLREIQSAFDDRAALPPAELALEFGFAVEPAEDVLQCLSIFDEEYGVPAGKLRQSDSLDIFSAQPRGVSILSWLFVRLAYEDRLSELNYHLRKLRRRRRLRHGSETPVTVGDYVLLSIGDDHPERYRT